MTEPLYSAQSFWQLIFPQFQVHAHRIVIELGPGKDSPLLRSNQDPRELYLGIEKLDHRIHQLQMAASLTNSSNHILIFGMFEPFLRWVPQGSVSRIVAYYPDPWPKRKHSRHRLISHPVLYFLLRSLTTNGSLKVVTDMPTYADLLSERGRAIEEINPQLLHSYRNEIPPHGRAPETNFEARAFRKNLSAHEVTLIKGSTKVWSAYEESVFHLLSRAEVSSPRLSVGQRL